MLLQLRSTRVGLNGGTHIDEVTIHLYTLTELPAELVAPLPDSRQVLESKSITLECEVSKPDRPAKWLKDGQPLDPTHFDVRVEGTKHFIVIPSASLDDGGKFTIKVENAESTGTITVKGKKQSLSSHLIWPKLFTVLKVGFTENKAYCIGCMNAFGSPRFTN